MEKRTYDYSKFLDDKYGGDPRVAAGHNANGTLTSEGGSPKRKMEKPQSNDFYTQSMREFDGDPRVAAGVNANSRIRY